MADSKRDDQLQDLFSRIGMRPFEVFYHVVELGGFSQAADELHLSQPTVSQHVKNLEETLGEPLLLRSNSGVSLTKMGEICFEKMKEFQAVRDDLEEEIQSYRQASRRELSLGASTIPGEFLLPRVLPGFRQQHPSITVEMEISESSTILEQIDDGSLRWGIIGTQPEASALEGNPLIVEQMRLVTSPDNDTPTFLEDPKKLEELPYVGRGARSGTHQAVVEFLRDREVRPEVCLDPVARLGTVQAVRESVVNGMGVSFLPESMVERDLRNNRLEVIETAFGPIERTFYGVENRFMGVPPVVETFRTFLDDTGHFRMVEQ